MRKSLLVALLLVGAAPAWAAEEPSGWDKFKWPIERERAALTAPDRARLTSGSEQAALPLSGITLALVAPADARLPMPPERAPREGTFRRLHQLQDRAEGRPLHDQPVGRRLGRRGAGRAFP